MKKYEINNLLNVAIYPLLFVAVLGLVHFIQIIWEVDFAHYGVFPRKTKGLYGILLSPFIHGSFKHLFNNAIPLIILGSAIFFFYKEIAVKVVLWIYLMTGSWTWIYARDSYHIGASGILYGLFSFLLLSGFIRKNNSLIALSFGVIFLYGSLVWGIFPIDVRVSFEGHLWGFVSGIVLALYYRKDGPQKKEYNWDEDDLDDNNPYWEEDNIEEKKPLKINYIYKPNRKKE